jgi:hypothetical protein
MRSPLFAFGAFCFISLAASPFVHSADKVFSGPQPGERTTPFKVTDVAGKTIGREWDVIEQSKGKPAVIVFIHGIERSIVPLLTVIDEYATERGDKLEQVFVFLSADKVESGKRLPGVAQSLRLKAPVTLSNDGAEGPGNYGLNKECLMTVLVAKDNVVTYNAALVQPGIADAPAIIAAMAKASGDEKPPTAEALRERRMAANGGGRGAATRPAMDRAGGPATRPASRPGANLPGAAPTDEKLLGLLRAFINRQNDEKAADKVIADVREYVKGDRDLTKQAIDGWTRVLHLKYGTEYAQKAGQQLVDELKKAP